MYYAHKEEDGKESIRWHNSGSHVRTVREARENVSSRIEYLGLLALHNAFAYVNIDILTLDVVSATMDGLR
jgi:hypothetical protein